MDLKEEGEKIGAEVYSRLAKDYSNLSYDDLKTLIDHIYAGIYARIYEETYNKKRGKEYWNGNE
jgi:hypothetical protein